MDKVPIITSITRELEFAFEKNLFGLNIFKANQVQRLVERDPEIEFLFDLCQRTDVSVVIGNLFDFFDNPAQLISNWPPEQFYREINTGCYGGSFYDARDWNSFPAIFAGSISGSVLKTRINQAPLVPRILQIDAMAFLVGAMYTNSVDQALTLLNLPFTSHDTTLKQLTQIFRLIGFTHADGDYFTFVANSKEEFSILDPAIESAASSVRESDWFRRNESSLIWDSEYSMCLMISSEIVESSKEL